MKLWTAAVAPNPRRVAIFLAEKGIEIPTVEIDLAKGENYAPEFVAKNPLARVPVLEFDDGAFLAESMAICRYLEETHPVPPLFGVDARDRANVEMWNRRMESEIMLQMTGCFRHTHPYWKGRIEQVEVYGELCRRTVEDRMRWLDGEMVDREFIAGEDFTVADITAVCGFGIGRVAKIRIPEELGYLTRWHQQISERRSVTATSPAARKG
jgi:glutathione S-transferase